MLCIKRKYLILKAGICIYIILCLIIKTESIKAVITEALEMWVKVIVPSVFPYLVISAYIASSDVMNIFERFPGKIFGYILGISSCSIRGVLCSLICGYPSGAICARSLYEEGKIDFSQAQRLICFTNNAGPLFLISAVGTGLLGSAKSGFAIYVIQLISSFLYGVLTRGKIKDNTYSRQTYKHTDICSCVKDAVVTTVNICGFMITAYVMAESVIILLSHLIPYGDKLSAYTSAAVRGIFEISAGVKAISLLNAEGFKFAIICFFVSWSGLSVIMQIKSVSGDIISFKKICGAKFIQAITSFAIGYGYSALSSPYSGNMKTPYGLFVSLGVSIVLFVLYLCVQRKKAV